jgi:HlyD family secretion protein
MSSTAIPNANIPAPRAAGSRRWYVWPAASLIALVALTALWGGRRISAGPGNVVAAGKFFTVTPTDLDIKVRKDGELQAVNNVDVVCKVEGRSTIVFLVKEGENVKKGDLLIELDSSVLRDTLETTMLEVKQAESDLQNSKEMLAIQENQNAADLQAAQVELDLARLALQQFEDGTYPQELADAETLVKMTEITVRNKEEDLEQTKALFAKGFVTAADVKQAELSVTTVHNDLRKAQTALKVLTKFKYATDLATNQSAVSQAEQKLARVRRTNASMLRKAQADVDTKEIALQTKSKKREDLEEQVANCKIIAPGDGMVVYARDDDDFRMVEGAQVRERQRLIRLPDTSQMKAVVKINESQVPRLRIGQRGLVKVVGVPDPVGATVTRISPMADGGSRWWNPELREYPVELVLDRTAPDMKPGLTLQCEVFVEQLRDVTAVPLASIYSQGRDSFVFARRGDDVQPVKVHIGGASETHAHITDGLSAGQDVLVLAAGQGRQLLERAGIAADDPMQRGPGAAPGDQPVGPEQQTKTASRDATGPKPVREDNNEKGAAKGETAARDAAEATGRKQAADRTADRAADRTSGRTGGSRSAAPAREASTAAPASTVSIPVGPAVHSVP